jgi:hypothetical protein
MYLFWKFTEQLRGLKNASNWGRRCWNLDENSQRLKKEKMAPQRAIVVKCQGKRKAEK